MRNYILSLFLTFSFTVTYSQVGVGNTTPEAELDITSTTRGLLIPRVALTNLTVQAPVTNPQGGNIPESTLVYHDGTNSITAGFYYWDGTQWVTLTPPSSNDWAILGNSGTNPTNNFVGTTDDVDFVVRTNNTEQARFQSNANGNGVQFQNHISLGGTNPDANKFVNLDLQTPQAFGGAGFGSYYLMYANDASTLIGTSNWMLSNAAVAPYMSGTANKVDYYGTGNLVIAQGVSNFIENNNSGTVGTAVASDNVIRNESTGTFTEAIGNRNWIRSLSSGTITEAVSSKNVMEFTNSSTATNVYGVSISDWINTTSGTIDNSYGLYIDDTIGLGATDNFAVYSSSTSDSYFQGNVGIGNTTPFAKLNVVEADAAETNDAISVLNLGEGSTTALFNANTSSNSQALYVDQDGTGGVFARGIDVYMDAANTAFGIGVFHDGTGIGNYIDLTNASNVNTGSFINHAGLGFGEIILMNNAANNQAGLFVNQIGTGESGVFYSTGGTALVARSSSVNGDGALIVNDNTTANLESIGALITYSGTGTGGTGGGGNALEVQHNGTNGNAVDIFLGDPTSAAGPANTTSEHTALTVTQMATGTSPTAGRIKSAISASNNSADPTIIVNNNGTDNGDGIQAFVTPNTNDPVAVYGQSSGGTADFGVGIQGVGEFMGVVGNYNGTAPTGNGVFATGDVGATGAKTFVIDYPLDPANKVLRHYAIESNEITNMYRGIITLDNSGKAIVKLPEYFNAVNKEPSYQLTPIGTPQQPYIFKEISNNSFVVGGKPNTKVSWTVYAKRNDPSIQYYDRNGKNYDNEIFNKPTRLKGKYYTPEAYGLDKTNGIFYNKEREKNYAERNLIQKNNKPMKAPNFKKPDIKPEEAKKNIIEESNPNK